MKKNWIILGFLLAFTLPLMAQSPQTLNFQGITRNQAGSPLSNTSIKLRLTVRDGSVTGTILYREVKTVTTNAFGLYQVTINDGTGTRTGNFNAINWAAGQKFLQTEIDPANGNTFTNAGTMPIQSVPYSFFSTHSRQWINEEPVIQTGTVNSPQLPAHAEGRKLIWYPRKGAFRAGFSGNDTWQDADIGMYSFATGMHTIARGEVSAAFGIRSEAKANLSIAGGYQSRSIGGSSLAMGYMAITEGHGSFSLGYETKAKGDYSIALGAGTVSRTYGSFALGSYNDTTDNIGDPWYEQRIFQIGIGYNNAGRKNAMSVLKNGNVGIGSTVLKPEYLMDIGGRIRLRHSGNSSAGLWLNNSINNTLGFFGARDNFRMGFYFSSTSNWKFLVNNYGDTWIAGRLTQSSDQRLKNRITPLDGSLEKLTHLRGYHYYWNEKERGTELQTGLLAQEVEKVLPELVDSDEKGYKTVNYIGIIPHLLEAIKSLKSENELLKKEMFQRLIALEKKIN